MDVSSVSAGENPGESPSTPSIASATSITSTSGWTPVNNAVTLGGSHSTTSTADRTTVSPINLGSGPSTAAKNTDRPIVSVGVVLGVAKRPIIHCTEEGFNGLMNDFVDGSSIEWQLSDIRYRRALESSRSPMAVSRLLN